MTPDSLSREVLAANQELGKRRLALFTFGNASAIDRTRNIVVIKPSGVPYDRLTTVMLTTTDLDGQVLDGTLRPSSDLATHLALYRAFPAIGGIVHTHSHFATAWAQAGRDIPCLGTTHADHFHGPVPVTAPMSDAAVAGEYEHNTGRAIIERMLGIDPMEMPAVLVAGHAPFCWGATVRDAVDNASVLEEVARMAYHTMTLAHDAVEISAALRDRHFQRKHGPNASYGQDAASADT